jgi:DNA (cytosine-5)-methyltransferase 1
MNTISVTEIFPGRGTLTRALTDGLKQHVSVSVAAAVELVGEHLRCFSEDHPEPSTFVGDATGFHPAEISGGGAGLKLLVAGIPCRGASKAGRAKNGGGAAEDHGEVGALFLPVLHYVRLHRPDLICLECVPEFRASMSARCIRGALRQAGYDFEEHIVNPFTEFQTPTERRRWVLVGSRHGSFQWRYLARPFQGTLEGFLDKPQRRDAAEALSPQQAAKDQAYLARKQAQGCNFRLRLIDRESAKCPVICATYGRRQPSAPYVRVGETYRQIRPREVARLHGFPRNFRISGSKSLAYTALGQGVCYRPFRDLGAALGAWVASGAQAELAIPA